MFVALIEEQQSGLWGLTQPNGQPAFDLPSGSMTLQHFLSGLPAGQHWGPLLTSPLVPALTVGQAREAFATIAGARPFAPTLIKEYVRDACENRS